MSLFTATLSAGLFLALLGTALLSGNRAVDALLKSFPRSQTATYLLFGSASLWFLHEIWTLSPADFGDYHVLLFFFFGAVAALAFYYVPDFLAVRGLAGLILLAAWPFLQSAYMLYQYEQRLFLVSFVYLLIFLSLWLGAQPFRMRDFIEWMQRRPARGRTVGGLLAAYGVLLCVVAFTY